MTSINQSFPSILSWEECEKALDDNLPCIEDVSAISHQQGHSQFNDFQPLNSQSYTAGHQRHQQQQHTPQYGNGSDTQPNSAPFSRDFYNSNGASNFSDNSSPLSDSSPITVGGVPVSNMANNQGSLGFNSNASNLSQHGFHDLLDISHDQDFALLNKKGQHSQPQSFVSTAVHSSSPVFPGLSPLEYEGPGDLGMKINSGYGVTQGQYGSSLPDDSTKSASQRSSSSSSSPPVATNPLSTSAKKTKGSNRKAKAKPSSILSNSSEEDITKGVSEVSVNGEDEDIVTKRKAQNRAAQRAFRERKEARVRELEQKLSESEKEKKRLFFENERLKKENTVIATENQVLLATGHGHPYGSDRDYEGDDMEIVDVAETDPVIKKEDVSDDENRRSSFEGNSSNEGSTTTSATSAGSDSNKPLKTSTLVSRRTMSRPSGNFPYARPSRAPLRAVFPVHKFNFELLREHDEEVNRQTHGNPDLRSDNDSMKEPSYIVYTAAAEETMLGAGAVWELIANQPDAEDIDVSAVIEFLKGKEKCDGFGPVFRHADVLKGINTVRESNSAMDIDD